MILISSSGNTCIRICAIATFFDAKTSCPAACFLIPIIAIVGVLAMIHAVSAAALCAGIIRAGNAVVA